MILQDERDRGIQRDVGFHEFRGDNFVNVGVDGDEWNAHEFGIFLERLVPLVKQRASLLVVRRPVRPDVVKQEIADPIRGPLLVHEMIQGSGKRVDSSRESASYACGGGCRFDQRGGRYPDVVQIWKRFCHHRNEELGQIVPQLGGHRGERDDILPQLHGLQDESHDESIGSVRAEPVGVGLWQFVPHVRRGAVDIEDRRKPGRCGPVAENRLVDGNG